MLKATGRGQPDLAPEVLTAMGSFEFAEHSSPQCLRSFCTLEGEPHRTPMGLSRPLARVPSPTQRECQAPPPCPQRRLITRDAPTGSACVHDSSASLERCYSLQASRQPRPPCVREPLCTASTSSEHVTSNSKTTLPAVDVTVPVLQMRKRGPRK